MALPHFYRTSNSIHHYIDIEACMKLGSVFDNDMLSTILFSTRLVDIATFEAHGLLVLCGKSEVSESVFDLSLLKKDDPLSKYLTILYKRMVSDNTLDMDRHIHVYDRIVNTLDHYGYLQPMDVIIRRNKIENIVE